MLFFIGLGLHDEKDISVKGLDIVKHADVVYLENYTSVIDATKERLENFFGKEIILAGRETVEQRAEETILKDAISRKTVLLVMGDPFVATTHADLFLRARKLGIKVEVVHNASIVSAIGITGLQVYKFGKVASIPLQNDDVETPYDILAQNQKLGLHTLFLLDLQPPERFMTVADAIRYLLKTEMKRNEKVFTEKTRCVGVARLGYPSQLIKYGVAKELLKADFGKPVHCLIVPGRLHFMEEEMLAVWK
ncbi:diphthine synthase [Candidatus Woesearchaeota archaeon]|nr:diphthine synthase [Candidatus Woesearchaeota archaeon]